MKKLFLSGCLLAAFLANAQGPTYQWVKRFGSTSNDQAYSVKLDGLGNVYTACRYQGTVDFDPGSGTANLTSAGGIDLCITKLNASGNFIWAKSIGGTYDDLGKIAIDDSGNVYVGGSFKGTADFDPGSGTANLTSAGDTDIYVCKLNSSGNFIWAKRMGGTAADAPWNLTVDASGNVYMTGYFTGTADFDPGTGTSNLTSAGSMDIFVCKLDASGNFVWAKSMGGTSQDLGKDIAVDASGNVYTCGFLKGTADFDPDATSSYYLTSAGGSDIYVSKLNGSGNFIWAKRMGGTSDNQAAQGMVLDGAGNVYTVGGFNGTADFDPNPTSTYTITAAGQSDVFISKLNASGNFIWARSLGGSNFEWGYDIKIDGAGNVYTTGVFSGNGDFDPGSATYSLTTQSYKIFISKLDSNGNFVWAQGYGDASSQGSGITQGYGLILDAYGNIYTTGEFSGTVDFDLSKRKANLTSAGGYDIFLLKLNQTSGFMIYPAITEQDIDNRDIIVYPNPTTGILNLGTGNKSFDKIEVINMQGQVVFNGKSDDSIINIQGLTNGLYLINLWNNNTLLKSQKLLKQ